jgi:hypothetical protein
MLLIHPKYSPITGIKLCSCFKVTIGLMAKSLSGFLPFRQVRKDACIFAVSGCIATVHHPKCNYTVITSPCSKGYSMSAFIYFYPSTNRCPSLWGIKKPPWSLWLKFTTRLRDLTDNCMCGVQRWGSHSTIMVNTIMAHRVSPCNFHVTC